MAKVVFLPSGKRGEFEPGTSLLQAARELGVDIDSVCGGRGICGRCQVQVGDGMFAKHGISSSQSSLSEVCSTEQRFFDRKPHLIGKRRLSCHCALESDAVIDVPPESQVHKQVVRKDAEQLDIQLDPVVTCHYVQVAEATMEEPTGDKERLLTQLATDWQLENLTMANHLLATLQPTLRKEDWAVTAAVRDNQVVGLWPGLRTELYGVSIDLGSTTISAHLSNLENGEVLSSSGLMNPQIRFGEDLMSRVSYSMMNEHGAAEMTEAVQEAIGKVLADLAKQAKIDIDEIFEVTLVANPIMHHLFLGIDPVELGGAPFALAIDSSVAMTPAEVNLPLNPGASVFLLPCIAGHVGADTAGCILAEYDDMAEGINLMVDVGTNAEIVMGNHQRMVAASSPTGPAFEGAQISCGQRAAPGAIERIRIDRNTFEPDYRVIGIDVWSSDGQFEMDLSRLRQGITGVCGSGIIELMGELYLSGLIDHKGVFDPALKEKTSRLVEDGRTLKYRVTDGEKPLYVTQNDVRAIQLAKAALYAGIKLLMELLGTDKVDRIRLAGAFGAHIDVNYATVLGLIPDCVQRNVSSAGNAAGSGARIALLNKQSREKISGIVKNIEKIETALAPTFQEHFVNAMSFPNEVDPFPELEKVMPLPPRKAAAEPEAGEGRRGRRGGRRRG